MTVQEIKELIGSFSASEAVELELKQSDIELALRKAPAVSAGRLLVKAPQAAALETDVMQEAAIAATKSAVAKSVQAGDMSQIDNTSVPVKEGSAESVHCVTTSDVTFTQIKAPLAGIFYRSASPEAAPYVLTGQEVKKGDIIGLIEAMKVMNEIPAPCDGVVCGILAENEAFVGYDEVLVEISGS